MSSRKATRPPARAALVKTVVAALEDMKASNIKVIDVRGVTDVSDCMIIASGNSDRHVRSTADRVVEYAKKAGFRPMGVEGERDGEWVLVDCNDVIVHVMLPRVREFYALESLWETAPKPAARKKAAKKSARPAAKSAARRPAARGKAPAKAKSAARKPAARAKTARKGS
ncbi:MAG: hypothetical protein RLZZ200_2442 [Pseudomonadota bacterium]|jgi:ribosome-associated protein